MSSVKLFLSAVSAEFRSYRGALRHDLARPNVTVKIQEDFIASGSPTLDKLDDYVRQCDAVIHLVGDMTGAAAQAPSVALIRQRYPDFAERLPVLAPFLRPDAAALSYTQWEAWLALYHSKRLIVAVPEGNTPRDESHRLIEAERAAQQEHLQRLATVECYPEVRFASADRLAVEVLRSKLHDILAHAGGLARPVNLPYLGIGDLFKGRDNALQELARSLGPIPESNSATASVSVLAGLGGVGKTRLAVEYAWRHTGQYTALLFVGASDPEAFEHNLAALCGQAWLDLPEQSHAEQAVQREAALSWLRQHPGWLLILDNVDAEPAARAVGNVLPQLTGGHVLVTSRLQQWGGAYKPMRLDVLPPEAAVEFLLARTQGRRRPQADEQLAAQALAAELGGLALALEQAGAYIAQRRQTFDQYLADWHRQRDKVLGWFDPRMMDYPASVAITWQTSFDQLGDAGRRLLQRMAWLAPEPVPESLLDVPVPDAQDSDTDPRDALVELESYSLVTRAGDRPVFDIHRLVQEVLRRSQARGGSLPGALSEALRWIDVAFVGDPQDVRDWPVLEPLAPHARAVASHGDVPKSSDATPRLMARLGVLMFAKASYTEAESLMRRALAIDEGSFGAQHPNVARNLNNLALLLQTTNRLGEAEPLMRRALAIDEASFGAQHPRVAIQLNNLAALLQATNRLGEAEPLMRRALAIEEANFGVQHPNVARNLNNLAQLLKATNRLGEAERLMRRALAIDEASLGAQHPNVARNLNNLALLLQDTNRLGEAEPLMRRALAIDEASLGTQHPKVALRLNNLALLLKATNRLGEAEPLMHRALAIDEASFGAQHPDVARDLSNLAQLLQDTNRLGEAEPLMRRALAIDEASLGAQHPEVATDLNNLAQLLQVTNRLGEAEPLMRRALAIDETNFGTQHPKVALRLNNLAQLLKATNRLSEAEPLMRRALAVLEASGGPDHPHVRIVQANLRALLRTTRSPRRRFWNFLARWLPLALRSR